MPLPIHPLDRSTVQFSFDKAHAPRLTVKAPCELMVETHDARSGKRVDDDIAEFQRSAVNALMDHSGVVPEGSVGGLEDGTVKLTDGSAANVTLHTVDGTIPQLRRALDRSLDAFFDLLPGAEADDVERFGE